MTLLWLRGRDCPLLASFKDITFTVKSSFFYVQNFAQSPREANRGNKKPLAKNSGCIRQNMASSSNHQEEGKATRKQNLESVLLEKRQRGIRVAVFTPFKASKCKS